MEVIREYPPNIEDIKMVFDVMDKPIIYAYGDVIYDPMGAGVTPDLEVHEGVHMRQQEAYGGVEKWWAEYLSNVDFRIEQEVEAYGAQYRYAVDRGVGNTMLKAFLFKLASDLSGPMYGNALEHHKAETLIRHSSKKM